MLDGLKLARLNCLEWNKDGKVGIRLKWKRQDHK